MRARACVCHHKESLDAVDDNKNHFISSVLLPCSEQCTIGLVMPIWSDTQVYLDGDG